MSREIKFRAWFRPTQEYKSRYLDRHKHELESLYWRNYTQEDFLDDSWINTDDFEEIIFEQYTGLKDKNGKEIYEGDIVKGEMGVFEVRWYDAIASFCFKPNTKMTWHPNCNQGTTDYMEVIGNIHENPELLDGKNE